MATLIGKGGETIKPKGFNKYKIVDDYAIVYAKQRDETVHEILVELDDLQRLLELNYHWYVIYHAHTDSFYARTNTYHKDDNGKKHHKNIKMHMLLMNTDENEVVDHQNHNTLDNRRTLNLRVIEGQKNSTNRKGKNKNNKSGYRNVSWITKDKRYMVQIQINGKRTRLGSFTDVHEAGRFAAEMREKYYGKYKGYG